MNKLSNSEPVTVIGLPERTAPVKVVQLFVDEQALLLCGTYTDFHAQILHAFLTDRQLPFEIVRNNPRGMPMPQLTGERHTVVGMGDALVFPDKKKLILPQGCSVDYDLPICSQFNERIMQTLSDWTFLS